MDPTRQYWAVAATAALLGVLAVVFQRPVLLYGGISVAVLLVARQALFVHRVARVETALAVGQSVTPQHVRTDEETQVTLAAELDRPSRLSLCVEQSWPLLAGGNRDEQAVELSAGDRSAAATATASWQVAGRATFEPPRVVVTGEAGLLRSSFEAGVPISVTVTPRRPRDIHVGSGGRETVAGFGGHRADRLGTGTDPAKVREYVPGDSIRDMDWKATARLNAPHVREYEVETDLETVLVVDCREPLWDGSAGETKFDYLREAALVVLDDVHDQNDPVSLLVVDEGGTAVWEPPGTDPGTYRTVRQTLLDRPAGPGPMRVAERVPGYDPDVAREKAGRLASDESAFGRRIRPFLVEARGYVQRIDTDSLFRPVRSQLRGRSSAARTVLFTDDRDRVELRQAVKMASRESGRVVVFLAPTALFEEGGLTDLEDTYDAYREFEEFRKDLDRMDGVDAFEVGPGDSVAAILSVAQSR